MVLILSIVVVVFVLFISGVAFLVSKAASRAMGQITKEEFKERLKAGWQVIDVRTSEEYEAGHIEGAKLVDIYKPDFREQVAKLDRSGKYLLYCRTGVRSSKGRSMMEGLGFEHVADLAGGYAGWTRE